MKYSPEEVYRKLKSHEQHNVGPGLVAIAVAIVEAARILAFKVPNQDNDAD